MKPRHLALVTVLIAPMLLAGCVGGSTGGGGGPMLSGVITQDKTLVVLWYNTLSGSSQPIQDGQTFEATKMYASTFAPFTGGDNRTMTLEFLWERKRTVMAESVNNGSVEMTQQEVWKQVDTAEHEVDIDDDRTLTTEIPVPERHGARLTITYMNQTLYQVTHNTSVAFQQTPPQTQQAAYQDDVMLWGLFGIIIVGTGFLAQRGVKRNGGWAPKIPAEWGIILGGVGTVLAVMMWWVMRENLIIWGQVPPALGLAVLNFLLVTQWARGSTALDKFERNEGNWESERLRRVDWAIHRVDTPEGQERTWRGQTLQSAIVDKSWRKWFLRAYTDKRAKYGLKGERTNHIEDSKDERDRIFKLEKDADWTPLEDISLAWQYPDDVDRKALALPVILFASAVAMPFAASGWFVSWVQLALVGGGLAALWPFRPRGLVEEPEPTIVPVADVHEMKHTAKAMQNLEHSQVAGQKVNDEIKQRQELQVTWRETVIETARDFYDKSLAGMDAMAQGVTLPWKQKANGDGARDLEEEVDAR